MTKHYSIQSVIAKYHTGSGLPNKLLRLKPTDFKLITGPQMLLIGPLKVREFSTIQTHASWWQAKYTWGETGSTHWNGSVWGRGGVDLYCNRRQPRADLLWGVHGQTQPVNIGWGDSRGVCLVYDGWKKTVTLPTKAGSWGMWSSRRRNGPRRLP